LSRQCHDNLADLVDTASLEWRLHKFGTTTVILIGQYDSPFVRRVAVAMQMYALPYEHRPWSTFGDAERIAEYNPLRRAPTLVLDSGESLIESAAILDHLDEMVGPQRSLIAERGEERRHSLRICAWATGLNDKAVALVYERALHRETSDVWIRRCEAQIRSVLDVLETDRSTVTAPFWFGEKTGHADIAVACSLRFLREAHPTAFAAERWPRLAEHASRCEALEPFQAVTQPFLPPS
jgi:glutathione S-transferase